MTHSQDVIRRLLADGWVRNHVKGTHQHLKYPRKPGKVTVPHPNKDLPAGTLRNIYRQAGWHWGH